MTSSFSSPQRPVQKLHLQGLLVADAEVPDLPAFPQNRKRFRHLLRLHQSIRSMEQQKVHIIGLQPSKAPVHRTEDVLLGKIVNAVMNGTLGLEHDLLPNGRAHPDGFGKNLLRTAPTVNIRMVKEGDPFIQRRAHQVFRRLRLQFGDPHTAQSNLRSGNLPTDQQLFHRFLPSLPENPNLQKIRTPAQGARDPILRRTQAV